MQTLPELFKSNEKWARETEEHDPGFFGRLEMQQAPRCLWIGCSDSRVPATQITGLMPGEIFVHRNIANVVVPGDPNLASVVQYAVDALKVEHIIVCGHYGCGGVQAALDGGTSGVLDQWLQRVREIAQRHHQELAQLDPEARVDRLCQLNVLEQSDILRRNPLVTDAWKRGQSLDIHRWIYRLHDGRLENLAAPIRGGAG
jgi:carbonic anhydrase